MNHEDLGNYSHTFVKDLQAKVKQLEEDKEYAWKNVHILERARQEQDKKYEALINRLLEGSDGIHGDWIVSEIKQFLETLK